MGTDEQVSRLCLTPREAILSVLGDVLPLLEKGVRRSSRYEVGDVIALILQGHMQLWLSVRDEKPEACCVTQIIQYPRAKVLCWNFLAGSNRGNWLKPEFESQIIEWAKGQGCTQMEACDARHGAWARVAEGWAMKYVLIGKDIV